MAFGMGKMYDLISHLTRQQAWSEKTFGPAGPSSTDGVLDHIRKELIEIELVNGKDLEEWIDVVILALDGAWRATGADPEQIAMALCRKHLKNESRKWPDWRTSEPGKAIEHIKD